MTQTTVTKEFNWCMAHRLEEHKGLCKNIHGHNYRMLVTIKRSDDDILKFGSGTGMVVDFKEIKELVNQLIVDSLDHAFVFNNNDVDGKFIAKFLAGTINQKVKGFDWTITAENMAKNFYKIINKEFEDESCSLQCIKITVYETPTSFASYEDDMFVVGDNDKI